jgi:hypothetical protein
MEEMGNEYKMFDGKPKGRRQPGRPRRRWSDNIKMDFKIGQEGVDWDHVAQDRDRWCVVVKWK